ncbi:hypothetical protein HBH98_219360 [Parastagonospora nodorum]|nr:hypothetical protein HBH54_182050 [Parastagonospora nodorum]KAH3940676.1 hypothetical protein HBH53_213580 [Parastagonospora nodorum]KAH4009589.1 hypothetical protein HBI13_216710 [Parastagonospora nodorum]KAH4043466.1 hypothetical protein HBH49_230720 [Parastagonospora nodorum]KAH4113164.1 hypothetical protein HBH47_212930 [Parastagonospora nodorum]
MLYEPKRLTSTVEKFHTEINSAFKEHIGRLGPRNGDLIMRKTQSYYQLYWPKGIAPLFTENLGICMVWSLSTTSDIIPTD